MTTNQGHAVNIAGTIYIAETCNRCNGTGVGRDITCADKINPGPYGRQCPKCSGRKEIRKALWSIEIEAHQENDFRNRPVEPIGEMPDWMLE